MSQLRNDSRPDFQRGVKADGRTGAMPPDPEITQANDNRPVSQGTVPLEENQRHPSDPLKPGEDDEYGTRLEKALSKVEPAGREVKDEDIMDPGHMTPGTRHVDNRS
ncbi:MAG TPA: hypothetical protein VIG66_05045 [Noviherbaspirillum sp.]